MELLTQPIDDRAHARRGIRWGVVIAALILALGMVLAAWIASAAFYNVHTLNNTLSVTGSATENVTADSAKWTVSVNRTAYESTIGSTQTRVSADAQKVVNFFATAGIAATSTDASPVFVDQNYSSDANSPVTYNVHESITVQSNDPMLIQKLTKDINSLIAQGVLVSVQAPEYYISTLPQLRVSLVGAAITDAQDRATQIASSTGQTVGPLQSASGGVVQVTAPNSVGDVSDYGSYDTSTIEKQVMVTARATFFLR